MTRVFLDANVLFSATLTANGVARAIFNVARKRSDIRLHSSTYALEEARLNLKRKAPEALSELRNLLATVTILEEPSAALVEQLAPLVPDPRDAHILAGAVSSGAHVLVTGTTKDFRELYGTRVRSTLVLRPREALDLLLPEG